VIALTTGVSAARNAGNAVDDQVDADRNGRDRKDRGAGPDQTIPLGGQVRFGLPGTPGEVQEDQAGRGARTPGPESGGLSVPKPESDAV
jgi:hypothetical protein